MNNKLLILIFSFFISNLFSQSTINWTWLDSANGGGTSIGNQIEIDKYDNTYVLGTLSNGDLKIGLDSIYSINQCLFMTKYSPSGQPLWLKKLPTTDTLASFCIDSTTRLFIGATTSLMKFDNSLNLLQSMPSSRPMGPYAGNNSCIYLFASYTNTFSFSTYSTVCTGTNGIVMIQMDTLFNVVNAQKQDFTAAEKHMLNSFDFNPNGSIYITGRHTGNLTWFNGTNYIDNTGDDNLYLIKLKHDFTGLWAKYIHPTQKTQFFNNSFVTAIKSNNNNLSLSFTFDSLATYNSITFTNTPSYFILSSLVLRLDTAGNYVNHTLLNCNTVNQPTINFTYVNKIQYDSNGNQYVMVALTDSSIVANTTTVTLNYGTISTGITPYYPTLLKFDPAGTLINTFKTGYVFDYNGTIYISDIIVKDTGTIFYSSRILSGPANQISLQVGSTKKIPVVVPDYITKNNLNNLNTIYPNPFEKTIRIISNEEIQTIKIYNNLGVLENEKTNLKTKQIELDFQNLKPGIHFLEITNSNGTIKTQKIIKT